MKRTRKVLSKQPHREHLRTATLIVTMELLGVLSIPKDAITTTIAIMVFIWDLIFIMMEADTDEVT